MRQAKHRDVRRYDALLNRSIRTGHDELAIEMYLHHPENPFGLAFIRATEGVDGYGIGPVYTNATRILTRLIRDGEVRNGEHLRRIGTGVLNCLGRHHRYLTWHRDHPLQPRLATTEATATTGADNDEPPPPLFARGVDVARAAVVTPDPAAEPLRRELLAAILRAARGVGLLHVRVAQVYRRFEHEFGTAHGAYQRMARLAILDDRGRVVKLRSWRAAPADGSKPDPRVVRQVRTIHLQARDRIRDAARRLGYRVPPAG